MTTDPRVRMSITGGNFKTEEERITLVISIPKKDVSLLRTYMEMEEPKGSIVGRFCKAVLRALPKEDNAGNSD